MIDTIKKSGMIQIPDYDADAQALELRTLIYYGYQGKDLLKSWVSALWPDLPTEHGYKAAKNFGLAKKHKPCAADGSDLRMRIVTSSCGTMLRPLEKLLTHVLKQLWYQLDHSIKDSKSLIADLHTLNDNLPPFDRCDFVSDMQQTLIACFFEQYVIHTDCDSSLAEPRLASSATSTSSRPPSTCWSRCTRQQSPGTRRRG